MDNNINNGTSKKMISNITVSNDNDEMALITNNIIVGVASFLNILTIVLVVKRRNKMKSIDMIMFSLTMASFIYIINICVSANMLDKHDQTKITVNWSCLILMEVHILQCLHLVLLAIQRFIALRYPIRARTLLHLHSTRFLLACFWGVIIMSSILATAFYVNQRINRHKLIALMTYISKFFIIGTGLSLCVLYTRIIQLLRESATRFNRLQYGQKRLVIVCCGITLSFLLGYVPLILLSVIGAVSVNKGVYEWHFIFGYNLLIGIDLILQPLIYHLNIIFSRNDRHFLSCLIPKDDNIVHRIIHNGLVMLQSKKSEENMSEEEPAEISSTVSIV